MTELEFFDDVRVTCERVEGSDLDVARAAWVSTKGERAADEQDSARVAGLINMLMRDRHGSPFEQVGFQFLVMAPIEVWREHMRHRMASYNEQSTRYSKLAPRFMLFEQGRALVQVGRPGAYTFEAGSAAQEQMARQVIRRSTARAYEDYESLLALGIAREVARKVLPVCTMSSAYVRMNLRALMNFLSLRMSPATAADNDWGSALNKSFPLREVEMIAEGYEALMAEHFPLVHQAFCANGRVAP